jgi:hypothetical protein
MCRKAAVDPRFRKYPPLPVVACDGYEPRGDAGARRDAGARADAGAE